MVQSHNSRNNPPFFITHNRQNYSYFGPINRILINCNNIKYFDPFYDDINKLKSLLLIDFTSLVLLYVLYFFVTTYIFLLYLKLILYLPHQLTSER